MAPEISIVIPARDEAPALPHLHQQLRRVLDGMRVSCELLFVDDGSTDETLEVLRRLASTDHQMVVLRFRHSEGKAGALQAGFDRARAAIVVTLDADLQDDPADIPPLLAKLEEGYDVVSGWRRHRRDRLIDRRIPSTVANRLISLLTGVRLHDYGSGLKAYRRSALMDVPLHGGLHRFLPALCGNGRARVTEIAVNHRPRQYGRSKYGLSRIPQVITDLGMVWLFRGADDPGVMRRVLGKAARRHLQRRSQPKRVAEAVQTDATATTEGHPLESDRA